jgi:hypothetical protein
LSAGRDDEPVPSKPSPEEEKAAVAQTRADLLQRMGSEGVDVEWARGARLSFERDLRALGEKQRFAVRDVECRTTMCGADLEWPRSITEKPSAASLAMQHYEMGCARFASIAYPDENSKSFTAKIVFDCAGMRAKSN